MSHSYRTNLVHCVFSTKGRTPSIPAERQEQLWAYLDGIANNHQMPLLAVGGTTNHVHLLVAIPQTTTVASAINRFKANSSRWLHEHETTIANGRRGTARLASVRPKRSPLRNTYEPKRNTTRSTRSKMNSFRCCANAVWNSIPSTSSDRCRAAGAPVLLPTLPTAAAVG
jgi:REP element-mobilizing transposase RayT